MNSVHEPGPNGDSKTSPSLKPGRKPSQVHKHKNWPNWPPGTPRCAQAWSYRGHAWPCRGRGPWSYRSSRLPCRSAHQRAPARSAARAVPCSPARLAPRPCASCCACRRRPSVVSWSSAARQRRVVGVCTHSCARCAARLAAQAHCIVIQLPSRLATLVTIHFCIAIQFGLLHPFPATIQNIVLQYNFMQPSHLQYKSCNTILVHTSLLLCNTKTVLQYKNFFFTI